MTYSEFLSFCAVCRRFGLKTLLDVKRYLETTGTSPRELIEIQDITNRLTRSCYE